MYWKMESLSALYLYTVIEREREEREESAIKGWTTERDVVRTEDSYHRTRRDKLLIHLYFSKKNKK